jgi:hypothetical protein
MQLHGWLRFGFPNLGKNRQSIDALYHQSRLLPGWVQTWWKNHQLDTIALANFHGGSPLRIRKVEDNCQGYF